MHVVTVFINIMHINIIIIIIIIIIISLKTFAMATSTAAYLMRDAKCDTCKRSCNIASEIQVAMLPKQVDDANPHISFFC